MAETMTRVKEDFRHSEHNRQLREQELRQIQQVIYREFGSDGANVVEHMLLVIVFSNL